MTKTLFFLSILTGGQLFAQYSTNNIIEVPFQKNLPNDRPAEMVVADFNNDGNADIVVDGDLAKNQSGYIEFNSKPIFFSGNGSGTLIPVSTTFSHPGNSSFICDAADYNKDGFVDILVSDFWANGMRLYNGHGDFTFTFAYDLPAGTHGAKAKFSDIDLDGDLDVVTVTSGSTAIVEMHVFKNTGNTFNRFGYPSTGNTIFPLDRSFNPLFFVADINRDGRPDVISYSEQSRSGQNRLSCWIQNVNGTFSEEIQKIPPRMGDTPNERFPFGLKDVNKDNHIDLIFFDDLYDHNVKVAYSEPQYPYFGTDVDYQGPSITGGFLGYFLQKALWVDVDNDGQEDCITHNRWSPSNSLEVIKDPLNINGNFSRLTLDMGDTDIHKQGHGLALADLDHDNDVELISLGRDNILRIFNNSTSTLESLPEAECSEKQLNIYPSPAKEKVQIDLCDSQKNNIRGVQIYGMNGDLLRVVPQSEWTTYIVTSGLIPGAYVLHVDLLNGTTFSKKFLKE
ncbi:FG-GAP-like repeat-containing protein [Chryseobacterium terrae]|uniref:FG-GAP-like repeat-containing protein n=1 Tax=Chryseobacterium terrae TaxID=3163299 RepID=A0ABW8XXU5_9FLAO